MKQTNSAEKQIRQFGFVALLFFGALCGIGVWRQREIATAFFGLLCFLGFLFLILPGPMAPVYRGWIKVGHLIGRGITLGTLTLAYYLVITPFALAKRFFGGRPLPLKPDKNASTYWVTRTEPAQPKERFVKRY